jgi:UDP-N-acetyl-D-glucosamine dehydrogenase
MPRYVIDRLIDAFGNLKGKKIQVFGVAYKANVSDTRETPATSVIDILRQEGAEVSWHDPLVAEWNGEVSSEVDLKADLGLVLVYHDKMKIEEFSAPIFSVNPNRNYPDWKPLLGLQS